MRTTTTTCTSENFIVTRTKPRKAFINSTMTMEVDVVLKSGGGLTTSSDSIVVIENIPATGTVVSTNGQIGASTIRFAAAGPMPVGGTIKFRYDILMPSITGTDVIFGGSVVRHTYSVTPSSCAMVPDTTTADTCMELFFVPGGTITDPISPLCTSCWSPMDCHACICFHYEHPSPTAATDSVHVFTCAETVCSTFVNSLNTQVRNIKDKHCEILKMEYDSKCNDPDNIKDMFVNSFDLDHFQYTLYYYDRAGNLIRTVAPRGVLDTGTGRYAPVGHYDYDVTKYEYNTLGQLERQTTPDGGKTVFAYDKRGKVRLSQNAKQFASTPSKVSYTMYDPLARVVEAGQLSSYGLNAQYPYADTLKLNDITFPLPTGSSGITYNKGYITKTVYNRPCAVTLPGGYTANQAFINNRISYTVTDRDGDTTTTSDQVYNIYSYDPHGNVASMIVYIKPAPNALVINYEYDLLSNKVTRVWHHKMYAGSGLSFTMPPIEDYLETQYKYDADKRLSQVSSTFQPVYVVKLKWTFC